VLKSEQMFKVRILIPNEYLDKTLIALGEAEVLHLSDIAEDEELKEVITPAELSEAYYKYAGIIARIEELASNLNLNLKVTSKINKEYSISEIEEKLGKLEEEVNDIRFAISKLEEKGELENLEKLRGKLREIADEAKSKLPLWLGVAWRYRKLEEAKSKLGKCGKSFHVIYGWIPKRNYQKLMKILEDATENKFIMGVSEPSHHDHPPTLIEHKGILTSFGALTRAIGVPSYGEIDPTPIMVLTFPLIFGSMFGDVGHGAIIVLAAIAALYYKRKGVEVGETLNYIVQGSPLLLLCGISSIIFGMLYGEFFGSEEWFEALFKPILHLVGKEHGPIWFSPYHEPMYLLKICIFIAIIHMISGLLLDFINKISEKEYKHAIAGPGTWLWLYAGGAYLFITYGSRIFEVIFDPQIIVPYVAVPLIVMIIFRTITEGPSEGFGSALESFLSSISNTVSYSRILALNMAHTIFAKLPFNFTASPIAFIGSFIAFNAIILTLEALLSMMHTLRLHWVEWFLKFYSGEGYEFKPFTLISL